MGKIKLVCFDLDGVLVDAPEWHYQALNKALTEVCSISISREDHESTYNGLPTKQKLDLLGLTPEEKSRVYELKQEYTVKAIEENAYFDDGKVKLHSNLVDKKISIAVVTNAIRETAELMLVRTGQMKFINYLVSNEDVQNCKPHPEGYWKAMSLFGVSPRETLIVEDSDKGFEAAIQTTAHVCRVKNPSDVTWENIEAVIEQANQY